MPWTDEQYERVARYLDGEPLVLTERELELAEEIRAGEAVITAGIDPRARHRAMDKARRRMSAELARPTRRRAVLVCFAAAEAVAVAAVLVIALTLQGIAPAPTPANSWADVPLEAIGLAESSEITEHISLVQQDIDLLEAELMMPITSMDPAGYEDDDLDSDLEELWYYVPAGLYLKG